MDPEQPATRKAEKHAPSTPNPEDEWAPTNPTLWEKVLEVARGDKSQFSKGERTIHAPNNGRGFNWPSPNGTAWAVKQYNGFGGAWKKNASDVVAERLTKDWLMGVRRTWLKLMKPQIGDWNDVLRAGTQLHQFVQNLKDQVLFVRRGPYTSVPSMSDGKKFLGLLKELEEGVSNARSSIAHWYHASKGDLLRHGVKVEDGERMFAIYQKDFEAATGTSVERRGGKEPSLTLLLDAVLKMLREDAKRIEDDEADGYEYEKGNRPAFKEFDLYGVKVIVDDRKVEAFHIEDYIKYLDEAYQKLKGKGLTKAWYGEVFIKCETCGGVNYNDGGGVGGHYHIGPNTISIYSRPSMRGTAYLVLHELGHRYWFKHMDSAQRARFADLVKSAGPKPKDDEGAKKWRENLEKDERPVSPVTDYGATEVDEAFAEAFAHYVMGFDMNRDQIESFKSVLTKQASFKRASFLDEDWTTLERMHLGAILTTIEADPADVGMRRLQDRGLVRLAATDSQKNRVWDITAKGARVVLAGLGEELSRRMEAILTKYEPAKAKELGEWIDANFRVNSPKTPKGGKELKEKASRLVWVLKHRVEFSAAKDEAILERARQEVESDWNEMKPHLGLLVSGFTDEGGKVVPKELVLDDRIYVNEVGFDESTLNKYARRLETLFDSVKGWRRKALAGSMRVILASPRSFTGTAGGKYRSSEDAMLVRATPSVLKRADGYGSFDYILIHELGHRYEYRVGIQTDFDRLEWQTTRYSMKEGESFAELFALGHFRLTGPWDAKIVERFEQSMGG